MNRVVVQLPHGLTLDCQRELLTRQCKARLANYLLHAVHRANGAPATANYNLAISRSSEKRVARLVATTAIRRQTEILGHYDSGYNCVPVVVDYLIVSLNCYD